MLTEISLPVARCPAPGRGSQEGNSFFRAWALLSKAYCAKLVQVEIRSVQGNLSISVPSYGLRTGIIFEAPSPSGKVQGFPPPPNARRRSCQTVQISSFPVCWWAADLSVTDMTRWPLQRREDGRRAETGKLPTVWLVTGATCLGRGEALLKPHSSEGFGLDSYPCWLEEWE